MSFSMNLPQTQPMNLTTLRKNIFQVFDLILETGVPLEVERNGHRLLITPLAPVSKLSRLTANSLIVGDPEELVDLEVGEWSELDNVQPA